MLLYFQDKITLYIKKNIFLICVHSANVQIDPNILFYIQLWLWLLQQLLNVIIICISILFVTKRKKKKSFFLSLIHEKVIAASWSPLFFFSLSLSQLALLPHTIIYVIKINKCNLASTDGRTIELPEKRRCRLLLFFRTKLCFTF